jgi:hypothetical protein
VLNVRSVCQQCNSLRATTYTPDDGPGATETCRVILEGHEIGVFKPGSARKVLLKPVVVYVYQETNFNQKFVNEGLPFSRTDARKHSPISLHQQLNKLL